MNEEALEDLVARSFPQNQIDEARAVLSGYAGPETVRVRKATVVLSDGDLGNLRRYVAAALQDFRDVLYWSELPPAPGQ